jgi:glucose/arabinose dehydrogenase
MRAATGGLLCALLSSMIMGCGEVATLPVEAGMGPHPQLPSPKSTLFPTVKIASRQGWQPGSKPLPASGLTVAIYAADLEHPRWLYLLPNGDVLVAETNSPPKSDYGTGAKGWFAKYVQKRAGARTPSANRITLLRDADGDGIPEQRSAFIEGLNSPFGMALVGNHFYVADTDALLRFPYTDGDIKIVSEGTAIVELPAGKINRHWTKNVIASGDGNKLYVTVGSNSNVAGMGMEAERGRAAIWEVDARTGRHRIFASGLRNPTGLAWDPDTGELWTTVNERDELGSDLVPDFMTAVHDGAFYGWPYSYFGQHVDERVQPQDPAMVAKAMMPDYALGPHTASLGLAASRDAALLPARFQHGMFVAQHGSWNRNPLSGYKVIFVPFAGGKPSGSAVDVLAGFVSEGGAASGRPVGVAMDKQGGLLVADDVGNTIWRVTGAGAAK